MDMSAKCPKCGAAVTVELEDDTCKVEGGWVNLRGFANCPECGETYYGTYESELKRGIADGFEFDD